MARKLVWIESQNVQGAAAPTVTGSFSLLER
jgi:hypothetical protein